MTAPSCKRLALLLHPDDPRYAAEIFDAGNGPRVRYVKERRRKPTVFRIDGQREYRTLQSFTVRELSEVLAPLAVMAAAHPAMQHGADWVDDDPDGFGFGANEVTDADVEASEQERAA